MVHLIEWASIMPVPVLADGHIIRYPHPLQGNKLSDTPVPWRLLSPASFGLLFYNDLIGVTSIEGPLKFINDRRQLNRRSS